MINHWFISDTHFGHANMLKFKDDEGNPVRPFSSCFEMDETMVENWNSVVRDEDHAHHVGDVTFRYDGYFNNIMSRLKGHKRLYVGNHDKLQNPNLFKWFEKVSLWGTQFIPKGIHISHVPLPLNQMKSVLNAHGHVHKRSLQEPYYFNLCVEVNNYTPVHLDTILAAINKNSNT